MNINRGKLVIYWDYELQKGADTSILNYSNGIEDYYQTEFILDYLRKKEIKSCFAVLGYAAEKGELPYHAPEQIRKMAEEGHEVGSHTYEHLNIANINKKKFKETLLKSKHVIEKITKQKCVSFVPPWNKPQFFYDFDINTIKATKIPCFSKMTRFKIAETLAETGYKTMRTCSLNFFKSKTLESSFKLGKIICLPLTINNGFGEQAKILLNKAIIEKKIAVVYAHPRKLVLPGPENKQEFISFCEYAKNKENDRKLDIVLPRDFINNN